VLSKYLVRLSCVAAIVVLLSGCEEPPSLATPTPEPPAAALLPTLSGYVVVEGETLTSFIGKLSGGAALLAGQPELAAAITAVDGIVGCYQQVGAARARVYSNQTAPLTAGAVAIADRNALADPVNLFRCVAPNLLAQQTKIQPCRAAYTLQRDGNEFYIIYAGATLDMCRTFCARLEGCAAHKP
jgi:hypothetical protein